MLLRIEGLPPGIHGVRIEGELVGDEHEGALWPLIAEARRSQGELRLLYDFAPSFEGFRAHEAWEDLKTGFAQLSEVERCAVVADEPWVRAVAKVAGAMVPADVRTFERAEWTEAVDWLQAETHERLSVSLLADQGVLLIQPIEAISDEDLEHLRVIIDTWTRTGGTLRGMVIHAYRFPGWEDLRTAFHHWRLAREKAGELDRVAVAVGGTVGGFVSALGELFTDAEVHRFEPDRLVDALDWVAAPAEEPAGAS